MDLAARLAQTAHAEVASQVALTLAAQQTEERPLRQHDQFIFSHRVDLRQLAERADLLADDHATIAKQWFTNQPPPESRKWRYDLALIKHEVPTYEYTCRDSVNMAYFTLHR